ncbi:hypothetical protein BET10_05980 [Pseudoalteromonas amylolytica]|uniref:Lipoprotein n=1 Tax=Pseudoalteromonas amylolytica TaxID=1859457 RepID=A0A1S1MYT1_9GAMM|nr:hypothetical protein BFC16_00815 [Pseudoalteromonas sp. JW3]OHU92318.1 hypothetical protein BET10_05980 [Pseudoalteromonas amylolytica]
MKITIGLLCVMIFLGGCKLTRVEGEVEDVKVKISNKDSRSTSSYKHCPPGLAKQGRCKN